MADRRRRGATLPILDTFVAATALVHGMAVVSRNVRHLEPLGVAVIDPWAA